MLETMFHESQFLWETYLCMMMEDEERYSNKEIFRLKRKWQIALRRYVLERSPCPAYARYFGLPIELFREWIEAQFDATTNWDNFSERWQFDHIVPLAYFNFKSETDLRLCWNFINIRIEKIHMNKNGGHGVDVIAAKAYFTDLLAKTGYKLCVEMIQKIDAIEISQIKSNVQLESFITRYAHVLNDIKDFSAYDLERINSGLTIADIIVERKMLERFGQ